MSFAGKKNTCTTGPGVIVRLSWVRLLFKYGSHGKHCLHAVGDIMVYDWLVVWNIFYFPIYWE